MVIWFIQLALGKNESYISLEIDWWVKEEENKDVQYITIYTMFDNWLEFTFDVKDKKKK